ncbi:hypothetical protein [Thalassospira xiamenensis]|uniref:hypothetical protein n=1 Tax=Thalassospira xiamenensis TaxID=220697 RepID=UPI001C687EEB|nr:hypothetical protein [Thalassospira xiamenensis]
MQIDPKYASGVHSALAGAGIRTAAIPRAVTTANNRLAEIVIMFSYVLGHQITA